MQMSRQTQLAPYSVALPGWIAVLGPGRSRSMAFSARHGRYGAAAVGVAGRWLADVTRRLGPAYALLLRLWIAAGLAAIAQRV